jgi:magnesium transporter
MGEDSVTVNICYVIEKHKLLGTISAMDLLTCDDDEKITDVMDENLITVNTLTDKEEVAQLFDKYDLLTIPVLDMENYMVGIVTVDDAIEVLEEETSEDIEVMAAITPTDKPYMKTGVFEMWKKRIPRLLILMLSATFTGLIITSFEDALAATVVLTAFIPMLMGTGGNAGSQSSVTIIRALSLGDVDLSSIGSVVWKELRVSLMCGITPGVASFAKVMLIDGLLANNPDVTPLVALVVSITVLIEVVIAKLVGCVLPILAKSLQLDPAVMASPFITTIVDAVSLIIYFSVAKMLITGII